MINQPETPSTLHELLGTKNKKEQTKRVLSLVNQINAPVVDLVLRYDGRTDQLNISLIGPSVSIDSLYKILDGARDMLKQQEFEGMKAKENQEQAAPMSETKPIPMEEESERTKDNR